MRVWLSAKCQFDGRSRITATSQRNYFKWTPACAGKRSKIKINWSDSARSDRNSIWKYCKNVRRFRTTHKWSILNDYLKLFTTLRATFLAVVDWVVLHVDLVPWIIYEFSRPFVCVAVVRINFSLRQFPNQLMFYLLFPEILDTNRQIWWYHRYSSGRTANLIYLVHGECCCFNGKKLMWVPVNKRSLMY